MAGSRQSQARRRLGDNLCISESREAVSAQKGIEMRVGGYLISGLILTSIQSILHNMLCVQVRPGIQSPDKNNHNNDNINIL